MRVKRSLVRLREEDGVTLVFVALAMTILLGATALSVDFGSLFADRRGMVNAADAASLAAAEAYALHEDECGSDSVARAKANQLATANVPVAVPDDRAGNSPYVVDCEARTVTVKYYRDHDYLFAPAVGIGDTQVGSEATAAWGPASGVGSVLPLMLTMGRLTTCDIPNESEGTDCWFYLDNGPSGLGTADWAFLNVQPDCAANKFGWNVSVSSCPSRVGNPDPTYTCPAFSDAEMRDLIANGSPALSMDPDGVTYVCVRRGASTSVMHDIEDLEGQDRTFPVNDPEKQIRNGGTVCPPPCRPSGPDFYAIIGFLDMHIADVYYGNGNWDPVNCPGPAGGNARCLHLVWIGFHTEPGPICEECVDLGVSSVELQG